MLRSKTADIVIIGAGPAGSRLAWQLARQNHSVMLIEKREMAGEPVCCTGLISPQCFAEYDLPSSLILDRFQGARIYSPSGEIACLSRPTIQALTVDRTLFDQAMMQKAAAAGARLELGATAENVSVYPDRATVSVLQNGHQYKITTKMVVIAAGLNQKFTTAFGLDPVKDFAIGAQLEIEDKKTPEVEVFLNNNLAPGFFAWKVPTHANRAKLGMIVRQKPILYMQKLTEFINERDGSNHISAHTMYRPIPLRPIKKSFADRMILVGDAAGQVKTTTGGGLYYGLLCADLAAEVLNEAVMTNNFGPEHLVKYEKAWRKRLRHEMLIGRFARNFVTGIGHHRLDRLFRKTYDSGLLERLLNDNRLSFDWHGPAFIKWLTGVFRP